MRGKRQIPVPGALRFLPALVAGMLLAFATARAAGTLAPVPNRCDNELAKLQFRNHGFVTSGTVTEPADLPCYYMEGIDRWNVQNTFRYIFERTDSGRITPPTGVRSAVPLGGLGAGTVELRADGQFRDWEIFNNSPGGGAKIQLDDAFFGLRMRSATKPTASWALQSRPVGSMLSIGQIEYSGAFPVSRLRFADTSLPLAVDLYAYCEFSPDNSTGSATPAVLFTFNITNPTDVPVDVSVLLTLPNYAKGSMSAIPGGASMSRTGIDPLAGGMTLRFDDGTPNVTRAGARSVNEIWEQFSEFGALSQTGSEPGAIPANWAVSARMILPPNGTKTMTLVMSWYFPNRQYVGKMYSNYYTKLYTSSENVAEKVLGRVRETWLSMLRWQAMCFQTSLPDWLQDALANSVATMYKTSFWLSDGRFRQWESFSCADVQPLSIHFYRSLPYVWFFPDLQAQLLRAYAGFQGSDGYVPEDMGTGCFEPGPLDVVSPRVVGDGASVFILNLYQHCLWTGDRDLLRQLWPNAKKAAQWQIDRSKRLGIPDSLTNTYDWWEYEKKDAVAYNAFLHAASMLAARQLALLNRDFQFASVAQAAFLRAQQAIKTLLWTGSRFRAWWNEGQPSRNPIQADALYGQLWARILGLGDIVPQQQAASHLNQEYSLSNSAFGLKVMQGDGRDTETPATVQSVRDNLVWETGSIDWASLNAYMNGDVQRSYGEAYRVIGKYQERLRDQWDYCDVTTAWDGMPWCNSHSSRQLIFWALPLAISGEQFDGLRKTLSFDPRVDAPARLPFFTPTASGTVELMHGGRSVLQVTSGILSLNELRIGGSTRRTGLELSAGQSVTVDMSDDLQGLYTPVTVVPRGHDSAPFNMAGSPASR